MIEYLLVATEPSNVEQASSIFGSLVQWFGVPGALMVAAFYALHKGWIRLGREATKDEKDSVERLTDWKARYADMDKRWADQYAVNDKAWQGRHDKLESEKDFWRDTALRNIEVLESTVDTAKKAVERLPGGVTVERTQ